jgi:hypothetical protein
MRRRAVAAGTGLAAVALVGGAATLNAAKDLFGTNSAQYRSVTAAWTAVNVK